MKESESNVLLMRVRRNSKPRPNGGSSQVQIPKHLWKSYFADTTTEESPFGVIYNRQGGEHRFVASKLQDGEIGGETQLRVELSGIKFCFEPIIKFTKSDDVIVYEAFDGVVGEGKRLYSILRLGLNKGTTFTSIKNVERASWWTYLAAKNQPISIPLPVGRMLTGKAFTHDPKLTQIKEQRKEELKKLNNKQVEDTAGYVYIMSHPHHTGANGWVSIGKSWNYETRLGNYNRGCPDRAYRLEYVLRFADCAKAEKAIHAMLDYCRRDPKSEWFKISIESAIEHLDKIGQFLALA
jgi:hypothetical protein